jgi:prepilin-type N-terminal cleavage/methylation domain-containing protein
MRCIAFHLEEIDTSVNIAYSIYEECVALNRTREVVMTRRSQNTHWETEVKSALFTLIELLVVISIIAILASMLLPGLMMAKDKAKEIQCVAQMKQVHVAGEMLRGDLEGMLPAWFYPWRPDGAEPKRDWNHPNLTNVWQMYGHPDFGWTFDMYPHFLIDYGYAGEDQRVDTTGSPNIYRDLAELADRSIFACPNGYAPESAAKDNIAELSGNDRLRLMEIRNDYNTSKGFTGKRVLQAYFVNMNAGSFRWYHHYSAPNRGFWKVKRWDSNNSPEDIAHIMENNNSLTNVNHMGTLYSMTYNSWSVGGVPYAPTGRHHRGQSNNIIYSDGHRETFESDYTGKAFPWKWL